jgi:hypothetical protein
MKIYKVMAFNLLTSVWYTGIQIVIYKYNIYGYKYKMMVISI